MLYLSGSSLRSWQLEQDLSACTTGMGCICNLIINFLILFSHFPMTTGLFNIDGDLKYLYGQLPQRITEAAEAVMVKKIRKTVYNISRAAINIIGFLMT